MNGQIDLLTLYNQDKEAFKQKLLSPEMWDMALARRNQLLKTHLSNVSKLAREFGDSFGLSNLSPSFLPGTLRCGYGYVPCLCASSK